MVETVVACRGLESRHSSAVTDRPDYPGRRFSVYIPPLSAYVAGVTVETFKPEIEEAVRAFDKFVICLDKTPDEFQASLFSLMQKAMTAYKTRGPGMRHGIALDKEVTIILSQTEQERPLCGIYFNLHSPYQKQVAAKPPPPSRESPEPKG
jgi:hypothetical protein